MWQNWGPRETVGQRKIRCEKLIAKLRKQKGVTIRPILIEGRKITKTFWGDAWCKNMESYADYAHRIDRGRSYARNSSIIDLSETENGFSAQVLGTDPYQVEIKIDPLPAASWKALKKTCTGKVDSLINLLSGSLDDSIMSHMANPKNGLFPKPEEIHISCNCPDWATLCKHAAAVLYGIGHRLDSEPELLFKLRQVDHTELASTATETIEAIAGEAQTSGSDLDDSAISDIFGIDIDLDDLPEKATPPTKARPQKKKTTRKKVAAKKTPKKKTAKKKTVRKTAKKAAKKTTKKKSTRKKVAAKKTPKKKTTKKKSN